MAKEELLEFPGVVSELLPNATFRVTLENGHQLIAYSGGKMRKHRIRVLAGDRVVERRVRPRAVHCELSDPALRAGQRRVRRGPDR